MAKCWHYESIDDKAKINCPNCKHWNGKKCKDEALLMAEFERRYRAYEYMMTQNRRVRLE